MSKYTQVYIFSNTVLFSKVTLILFFEDQTNVYHCLLRVLKTSLLDPRCQTYVFESRIAQGIQIWVQNNQLLTLPSTICFKKLFSAQKNHQKNNNLIFLWFFWAENSFLKKIVLGSVGNWLFWTHIWIPCAILLSKT